MRKLGTPRTTTVGGEFHMPMPSLETYTISYTKIVWAGGSFGDGLFRVQGLQNKKRPKLNPISADYLSYPFLWSKNTAPLENIDTGLSIKAP